MKGLTEEDREFDIARAMARISLAEMQLEKAIKDTRLNEEKAQKNMYKASMNHLKALLGE